MHIKHIGWPRKEKIDGNYGKQQTICQEKSLQLLHEIRYAFRMFAGLLQLYLSEKNDLWQWHLTRRKASWQVTILCSWQLVNTKQVMHVMVNKVQKVHQSIQGTNLLCDVRTEYKLLNASFVNLVLYYAPNRVAC